MQVIRIGKWAALGPPVWSLLPPEGGVLGRASDCDLRLDDPAVSMRHAGAEFENGLVCIRDLGSRHGIMVDGRPTKKSVLQSGSNVHIVSYTLKLAAIDLSLANEDELETLLTRLYEQGRQKSGLLLAEAWCKISPKSGGALRMLAWFLLGANRLGEAARAVEKALWRAPEHPATRLAGALLAERQGRLEDAAETLEELATLRPPLPLALRALSRVRKKEEVYAKLGGLISHRHGAAPSIPLNRARLRVGRFCFSYTAGKHDQLVQVAYAALAQASEQINRRLGYDPGEVEVVIKDELESGGGIEAAALYRGVIELHAVRLAQGDPNFLYVALAHEYVHLLMDRICGSQCPRWLDEGLAQYLTQNPSPRDRSTLDQARLKDALLPLAVLEGDFAVLEHPVLVDLAYAQSYSLVEFLAGRLGGEYLGDMLEPFDQDNPEAAQDVLCGISLADLEKKWQEWLK